MERAYLNGDASYDGVFYLAVKTTGIFCRPSCTARKPKPENVEFFSTVKEAMFAGYRACLRCRPLEGEGDRHGLTFQAYCRARRLAAALDVIKHRGEVDEAVFDAGYESHSGFRDAFARVFSTAPGQAVSADAVRLGWMDTPIGPMIAGATDTGINLLEFTGRRMLEAQLDTVQRRFKQPLVPADHPHLDTLKSELQSYFAGTLREFSVPVVAPGTDFEERVWAELCKIPYGETRSYEDVAIALGNRAAVRAVGRANGLNRIAIVIPCHRVVNKSGELGGYGGGLWRKRRLLHLEKSSSSQRDMES
ncbi:MAG: bifunctional transcriptional activator/DNA repair protein Ada [Acidimicrobiia bacterium]|nr:bifunctional transcriptional activator/DNA repair protein Ada [Acidimicrobiia bacterium]